ncbi:hypothetical protein nbrc107696_32830 [Gordonia spumicola]|uniref:Uncharacterized protein n=1 Tax=Gordonia spumicola TaxID=589161 RepID=A0A7I9VC20_9ACTN|nr:hypothetical protein [Gordonia spumicola]GEE02837.1 hypothetical protein nbrc107696_32830 [Gordonia spumicola]
MNRTAMVDRIIKNLDRGGRPLTTAQLATREAAKAAAQRADEKEARQIAADKEHFDRQDRRRAERKAQRSSGRGF